MSRGMCAGTCQGCPRSLRDCPHAAVPSHPAFAALPCTAGAVCSRLSGRCASWSGPSRVRGPVHVACLCGPPGTCAAHAAALHAGTLHVPGPGPPAAAVPCFRARPATPLSPAGGELSSADAAMRHQQLVTEVSLGGASAGSCHASTAWRASTAGSWACSPLLRPALSRFAVPERPLCHLAGARSRRLPATVPCLPAVLPPHRPCQGQGGAGTHQEPAGGGCVR